MTGIVPVVLRGEPSPTYELALRAKDGTRVEMLFNATARRDATGAIVGLLGVGQVCHARLPPSRSLSRSLFLLPSLPAFPLFLLHQAGPVPRESGRRVRASGGDGRKKGDVMGVERG